MRVVERLMFVRSFLLIMAVLALAACGGGSVASLSNVSEIPTAEELIEQFAVSAAALEDLESIAGDEGWTLQEALYRVAWQEGFGVFLQELREAYPIEFAGGGILGAEGPRNVFISFASAVPAEVRDDPRLQHLDVEFREAAGFSEEELSRQTIEVHQAMLDAGFTDVATGPNIHTGMIEVQAERRTTDRSKSDSQILALLSPVVRASNVTVVFFDLIPDGVDE